MYVTKPKIQYLEAIRGLAAIIVVLHHYTFAFFPTINTANSASAHYGNVEFFLAQSPFNIFYNGGFAVTIFFTLSGYVLSHTYFKTHSIAILKNYAIKRYFRLLLPVGASIVIAAIFMHLGLMHHTELGTLTKNTDWLNGCFYNAGQFLEITKNIFIAVFFMRDNTYNPVLWTITYELLGSFLIFGFLMISHPIKNKLPLFAIAIFVLFCFNQNFYASFLLGSSLHVLTFHHFVNQKKWVLIILALLGFVFASYPTIENPQNPLYVFITSTALINYEFYHVIGSFLLLYVVLHSPKIQTLLSHNTLSYIGKISFSFYLLHFIVLCSLSSILFMYFEQWVSYGLASLFSFVCSIPIIIISAHYYYIYVDKLGITFSEKIAGLITKKQ